MTSTTIFELEAEVRENSGRGASRRLRHTDKVPAVLYGAGEPAVSLIFDHNKLLKSLSVEAFYSHILTLKVGKKNEKVILKAVQRHPAKPRIMHLDLLRIRADQKLHMHIPLHIRGAENAPGVKDGGIVLHGMSDIEVICLPADLPEYFEVDISNLAMNGVVHLSDIKPPKGVEFAAFVHGVEEHDLPVVSIHMPRAEEEIVEVPVEEEPVEGAAAAAPAESTGEAAVVDAKDVKGKKG
jgi:large subunit ribosomal protein L25